MKANATQIKAFIDNGDFLTVLGRFNRGMVTGRAAANHNKVEIELVDRHEFSGQF